MRTQAREPHLPQPRRSAGNGQSESSPSGSRPEGGLGGFLPGPARGLRPAGLRSAHLAGTLPLTAAPQPGSARFTQGPRWLLKRPPSPNTEGPRRSGLPHDLLCGGCFSLDSENSCSLWLQSPAAARVGSLRAHAQLLQGWRRGVVPGLEALEIPPRLGAPADEWASEMTSEDPAP